jgi:hypothetical protein
MQEPIDNNYSEFLTREEELLMQDKEELIKYILELETENVELKHDLAFFIDIEDNSW